MFPPINVCPSPPFDPSRLAQLGVNISVGSVEEVSKNIENLIGLDRQLTLRQLLEEAAWKLEDMVDWISLGVLNESYSSRSYSQLWRRSFTPVGPCLKLTLPLVSNHNDSIFRLRFRDIPRSLEPCMWVEKGRSMKYESPNDCSSVQRYCNTTCVWQQYLVTYASYFQSVFLGSTSVKLDLHHMIPQFSLQFREGVLKPIEINGNSAAEDYNHDFCYHKCLMSKEEAKLNCSAMYEDKMDNKIDNLCITFIQTFKISIRFVNDINSKCLNLCKVKRHKLQWVIEEDSEISEINDGFTLRFSSPYTVQFTKQEAYPLSRLLTDVGGSLGLFLGFSLMDLWVAGTFLIGAILNRLRTSTYGCDLAVHGDTCEANVYSPLSKLTGIVFLASFSCVHLLVTFKDYILQPEMLSCIIMSRKTPPVINRSLEELFVTRFASRPLGCKFPSSDYLNCFYKCLLRRMPPVFFPFIEVNDLPDCTVEFLKLPRYKFVIQLGFVKQHLSAHVVSGECSLECDGQDNSVSNTVSVDCLLSHEKSLTILYLLCSFGGILGLYFGFSLMKGIYKEYVAPRIKILLRARGKYYHTIHLIVTAILVLITAILYIFQVNLYLMGHLIYMTLSSRPLETRDLPAVTGCIWPPFNMQRLMETVGLAKAYDQLTHLSPVDRHAAITRLLQELPETAVQMDPQYLWSASAWTAREANMFLTVVHSSPMVAEEVIAHSDNSTILNQCFIFIPIIHADGTLHQVKYNFEVFIGRPIKEENVSGYIMVHRHDDFAIIGREPMKYGLNFALEVSGLSSWDSFQGSNLKNGECVSRCLDDALVDQVRCRLPWVGRRQDLPVCNMTQFTKFLTALWRLEKNPQYIYSSLVGASQTSTCEQRCQPRNQRFYRIRKSDREYLTNSFSIGIVNGEQRMDSAYYLTASIEMTPTAIEVVKVEDGYPTHQLVSDLGGIAGMTLGFSLLSLLMTVIGYHYASSHSHRL
nr:uncharacterized protein LOC128688397 [Cherax quadricarinatus]